MREPVRSRPRRRPRGLVAALLLAVLAGCAGSAREPAPKGLTRITSTGELRVGVTGDQPPLNMTAKSGELIGLEVALARVLAQAMGVRAKFVVLPFGQLLGALEDGRIDVVMSGMTITPERAARVTLVGPYYTSGKAILTKSEALAAAAVPQDLDSPQLRFAALRGSTSEAFARGSLARAKLVLVERAAEGIRQVTDGEVDGFVADRETVHVARLRRPDAGLHESAATFTVEPMGIAVRHDEPHLARLLQTYLTALDQRGTLARMRRYWLDDLRWVEEIR